MKSLSPLLVALLALYGLDAAADTPKPQAKADTRSDYLRSESVKAQPGRESGKVGAVLDINSAPQRELASLPGIGEARAKAIVGGRPYKHKDELLKKRILPPSVYKDVEDILIARAP